MRAIHFFAISIVCLVLPMAAYSMSNVAVHASHRVSCPHCLKSFAYSTNMTRHKKAQHEGKWYQCIYQSSQDDYPAICIFRSKDSTRAKEHIMDMHGVSKSQARGYLRIMRDDGSRLYPLSVACVLAKRAQQ